MTRITHSKLGLLLPLSCFGCLLAAADASGAPATAAPVALEPASGYWVWTPREKPGPWRGYLAAGAPAPLRFASRNGNLALDPSPALPEFGVMARPSNPVLEAASLSKAERARREETLPVETLDTHVVVSGKMDLSKTFRKMESVELRDTMDQVLRPEEVLIYFETGSQAGDGGESRFFLPVSPAPPALETFESSARLNAEE